MLVAESRSPQSAGPTEEPIPSSAVEAVFAAVSSPGVRAKEGSSAACAGQKIVD
jgi:hypothetical protein